MNHYFKKIRVISPEQKLDKVVNLWVKDGIIKHCSEKDAEIDSKTTVITSDKFIAAPGFFDLHVHLREPGQEQKEDIDSGCESAANGGFTGICCMPNTDPAIDHPTVVEFIKQKAKDNIVDVSVSGAITVKREGRYLAPMLELNDYGVAFFTDDGNAVQNSNIMKRAFEYAGSKDLLLAQHCEDALLTEGFSMNEGMVSTKLGLKGYPSVAEEVILSRDIYLADYCGNRRYHAQHISTAGAVELIRKAKENGLRVTCEVAPHHFSLNDSLIESYDTNFKMNPPLRTDEDIEEIKKGIADGTIDCIATDHAPHTLYEKEVEFEKAPCGIIGLETSLGISISYLVNTGVITLNKLIELMSLNPRKIIGLPTIIIKEKEEANLSIFAPGEEWIVDSDLFKSKSRNTPYNGMKLKGKPKYTINNNKIYSSNL
ncbi:MAG: dihydroorotase [Ignavibacteriae bacterium]|nr:dihydroorotase [Ignavibacteriota bacterium]